MLEKVIRLSRKFVLTWKNIYYEALQDARKKVDEIKNKTPKDHQNPKEKGG